MTPQFLASAKKYEREASGTRTVMTTPITLGFLYGFLSGIYKGFQQFEREALRPQAAHGAGATLRGVEEACFGF